ncbi:MAG: ankyrin repeat domain-containing protein [Acidobacteriota bacterium]
MVTGIFPLLSLLVLAAFIGLVILAVSVVRRIRRDEEIRWRHILGIGMGLCVLDYVACMAVLVAAGLSHSAEAIRRAPLACAVLTILLVVVPVGSLVWLKRKRAPAGSRWLPQPPAIFRRLDRTTILAVIWVIGVLVLLGCVYEARYPILLAASRHGISALVRLLVLAGVNADCSDPRGSPIEYAVEQGDTRLAIFLIEHGSRYLDDSFRDGSTALSTAARKGYADVIEVILRRGCGGVDVRDRDGRTALMGACLGGHMGLVRSLLDRGADVNAEDDQGFTPLMAAVYDNHPEVVAELLRRGADPHHQDRYGRSPLRAATQDGDPEMLRVFEQAGVRP